MTDPRNPRKLVFAARVAEALGLDYDAPDMEEDALAEIRRLREVRCMYAHQGAGLEAAAAMVRARAGAEFIGGRGYCEG